MLRRIYIALDPFMLMLMGTVLVASLLPARGQAADIVSVVAMAGVVLLFFLHGAKLSREAILAGMLNWRLHLAVLAATYLMFPLLGLLFANVPGLNPQLAAGMLFLTFLPSTVQSSIAFTSMAGGNVAGAVCSASFSNLLGVFLAPILVSLSLSELQVGGGLSGEMILKIIGQLLLPFILGHLCRPWIGGWISRRKSLVTAVDRGSILMVVYAAFGAAVVQGVWQRLSLFDLLFVGGLCALLLVIVLLALWGAGRFFGFPHADAAVLLFADR